MTRFVYLAEPIDAAITSESIHGQTTEKHKNEAINLLNVLGVGVYRPRNAFAVWGVSTGNEINQINTNALFVCDALLAFLPTGTPTIGVPFEIEQAIRQGKPVAVVNNNRESWALERNEDNYRRFLDYKDAVNWLNLWMPSTDDVFEDESNLLPFKRLGTPSEFKRLPFRGYADDAGLDLTCSDQIEIPPGEFRDIPTGVACGFPPGVWGMILGRSSTLRKRKLLVSQAVIDPGYRGELFAGVFNPGSEPVKIEAGERIAQIVLLPSMSQFDPVWTQTLPASHDGRGESGFGSTDA